jgi:hypothetical protein
MPVKVKTANSLAKDLTDLPVAVLKLTGAGMHDDPFMAIASKKTIWMRRTSLCVARPSL